MNINNAFPSKYLKSGDIESDLSLTISDFAIETLGAEGDQEERPVVYFEEVDKGLVLNKTNADVISQLHGPETEGWLGKQITIFATQVDFRGKQTLAIRVRLKAPGNGNGNGGIRPPQRTATPQPAASTAAEVTEADLNALWTRAKGRGMNPQQFRDVVAGLGIADPRKMSRAQMAAVSATIAGAGETADLPF